MKNSRQAEPFPEESNGAKYDKYLKRTRVARKQNAKALKRLKNQPVRKILDSLDKAFPKR